MTTDKIAFLEGVEISTSLEDVTNFSRAGPEAEIPQGVVQGIGDSQLHRCMCLIELTYTPIAGDSSTRYQHAEYTATHRFDSVNYVCLVLFCVVF